MLRRENDLISRVFFLLLPVQILMVAVSSINSILDGAIATNLIGPSALAAVGLLAPVLRLTEAINALLTGGAQILCGRYLGKNMEGRCRSVFTLDMVLTLTCGLLLSAACLLLCDPLSRLLGAGEALSEGLRAYMRGYAPGFVPALLIPQLAVFLQMEKQEKRTCAGMAAMILTNAALDLLFVKGLGLGLFGLGLATSVSNWAFALILGAYSLSRRAVIRFTPRGFSFRDCGEILRIGVPGALCQLALALRGAILNLLMLRCGGEAGVSAFSAVNSFGALYYAVTAGVASATRMLCSVSYGEEDRDGLARVMKVALTRGLGLVCAAAALLMVLSGSFTRLFYAPSAGAVYTMARRGFLLFPLSMPLSCVAVIFINVWQATKKDRAVILLSLLDGLVGVTAFSALLSPALGMDGIWLGQVLGGLVCPAAALILAGVKNHRFPSSAEDLLALPPDFGVEEKDRIDLTVRREEEVVRLSERIGVFCREHGMDARRSMAASLAVEEMAGNIVEHGFRKDRRPHAIHIRAVYRSAGEMVLSIKDNCVPFRPTEADRLLTPDDPVKNIGIRLTAGLAKEMSYQYVFGLNTLYVRL